MALRALLALLTAWFTLPTAIEAAPTETSMSFFDLSATSLTGQPVDMGQFRGKVLLVVNTASECGYTPQYAGLEALYQSYREKGVVVLGFPSNDFGKQEPGSAEEIATFCRKNFGVEFPMFEKVATRGEDQSPVYRFLAAKHPRPKWNFHKYLVGKDGQVRAAFGSSVKPESAELHEAIDTALSE
jgi:glutathione peroxidase